MNPFYCFQKITNNKPIQVMGTVPSNTSLSSMYMIHTIMIITLKVWSLLLFLKQTLQVSKNIRHSLDADMYWNPESLKSPMYTRKTFVFGYHHVDNTG